MLMSMSIKNSNQQNIERIINLMQTDDSIDAPKDAIKWSKNIFRSRIAEPKKSLVEKIIAVLQIDLSKNQTAFGERFSGAKDSKQIFVEAGEYAVDVRIEKAEKGWNLHGQVLGEIAPKSIIRFEGRESVFEAEIDEFGEFICRTDSLENYKLLILPPE